MDSSHNDNCSYSYTVTFSEATKASGDSSHLAVIFRIIEYRGPKRAWLLFEIEFYEYFVPICMFRIFETKIVAPNVLLGVKVMAADPSSGM